MPRVARSKGRIVLTEEELQPRTAAHANYGVMSDTEDYPGPTQRHPEKQGQDPRGRADEHMVKPPSKPEPDAKKDKTVEPPGKPSSRP
jgi:hypothetical protein